MHLHTVTCQSPKAMEEDPQKVPNQTHGDGKDLQNHHLTKSQAHQTPSGLLAPIKLKTPTGMLGLAIKDLRLLQMSCSQ